jgi:Acetyltransferase (GNAT) domain
VPVEIRHPVPDEAADYLRSVNTSFLQPASRDEPMAHYWADVLKPDLDRSWAAFDRGRAVASLRSLPFEVTVPGGRTVPGDGVTMVTVARRTAAAACSPG